MMVIVCSQDACGHPHHVTEQTPADLIGAVELSRSLKWARSQAPASVFSTVLNLLPLLRSGCHSLQARRFHAHFNGAEERRETARNWSATSFRTASSGSHYGATVDPYSGTPSVLVHREPLLMLTLAASVPSPFHPVVAPSLHDYERKPSAAAAAPPMLTA